MKSFVSYFLVLVLSFSLALGDSNSSTDKLPKEFRLNGTATQDAFGSSKNKALHSTVRLTRNDKLIAMGAIISPEGHILTKASSCVGAREATLSGGEKFKLRVKKSQDSESLVVFKRFDYQIEYNKLLQYCNIQFVRID
ncbi:MAG: hypothetical protein EBR93_03575 [Bacteroidetes bacterium]|nr:hypothetical protein [Bacteroidota bacterium]